MRERGEGSEEESIARRRLSRFQPSLIRNLPKKKKKKSLSPVRRPRRPQPGPRHQALLRHLHGRRAPVEHSLLSEGQQAGEPRPLRQRRRRRRRRRFLAGGGQRRRRGPPRGRLGPAPRLVQALAAPPLGRRGPPQQQGGDALVRARGGRLGLHLLPAAGRCEGRVRARRRLRGRALRAVDGPKRGPARGSAARGGAGGLPGEPALRLPQGDGAW